MIFKKENIYKIKEKIQFEAFKNHIWMESIKESRVEIENFISRFREKYISCELIRIGGDGDGGYLLPDILNDISYCFSPGVSQTSFFEKELSENYNIQSFMVDASVDKPPLSDLNFHFLSKYLGTSTDSKFITLSHWLEDTTGFNEIGKILQMDIEGAEYDVLIYEDAKTLASFSIIIIEFHFVDHIFKKDFLKMISSIFEKIYKYFSICHVHPNNDACLIELDGIAVPKMMEVTFIRNDLLKKHANNKEIILPHVLDKKNVKNKKEIIMPRIWWDK